MKFGKTGLFLLGLLLPVLRLGAADYVLAEPSRVEFVVKTVVMGAFTKGLLLCSARRAPVGR